MRNLNKDYDGIMPENTIKKFGFIVHCRTTKELRLALARFRGSPACLLPEKKLKEYCLKKGYIEDIFTFREVISDKKIICRGKAYCLLLTPDQFFEHQTYATELVIKASKMAEAWGAEMIGLGAICAVVGARGVEVAESCTAAVTTGNSLTVHASIVAFEKIMDRLGTDPSKHKIAIIGFPGSIGLAITKILHKKGLDLIVVSRRKTAFLRKFIESLDEGNGSIEITQDVSTALKKAKIIFSTTSAGQIIDQDMLLPGSVVFDIAQPKDVIYKKKARKDVLIIDAGLISLPRSTKDKYLYSGLEVNDIPSCLGETITLTFEKRWERFSLGRELGIDKVQEIGMLSEEHGFVFDDFRSFQKPLSHENIEATKKALNQTG
ncbi:MAG: hypothetical protein JRF40_11120 [Deltaproteobacteria bacterium]|nr:hypothetical protein [Deltaproteobacteria bacterium]